MNREWKYDDRLEEKSTDAICERLKQYQDDMGDMDGAESKLKVFGDMCSYLLVNQHFMERYSKFKDTVLGKLDEFDEYWDGSHFFRTHFNSPVSKDKLRSRNMDFYSDTARVCEQTPALFDSFSIFD